MVVSEILENMSKYVGIDELLDVILYNYLETITTLRSITIKNIPKNQLFNPIEILIRIFNS